MIDILNKYLFLNRSINIPGIGTIFIECLPAVTDFINKQISPPRFILRFDKYFDSPGKDFFSYLGASLGMPDYETIEHYNQFAQDMRTSLKTQAEVLWKDVGYFKNTDAGDIEFRPLEEAVTLYAAVPAERVFRSNVSHAMLVGDQETTSRQMTELLSEEKTRQVVIERKSKKIVPEKEAQIAVAEKTKQGVVREKKTWLIYASVLFVIALVILLIHFSRHGFSLRSLSNQQRVTIVQPG